MRIGFAGVLSGDYNVGSGDADGSGACAPSADERSGPIRRRSRSLFRQLVSRFFLVSSLLKTATATC